MKFLNSINVVLLTVLVGACSTSPSYKLDTTFEQALLKSVAVGLKQERALFKSLCLNKKNQAACVLSEEPAHWQPQLPILQGSTDETQSEFVITHPKKRSLRVYALDNSAKKLHIPSYQEGVSRVDSARSVLTVGFSNLTVDSDYTLLVLSKSGRLLDFRSFTTLKTSGDNFKFSIVSCMKDALKGHDKIWDQLSSEKIQAIFMIGDNAYLDNKLKTKVSGINVKTIWRRHHETREALKLFRQKRLVPVFSTWDDHDYGVNDGGQEFKFKEESKKIFKSFFPMGRFSSFVAKGPGVSSSVVMNGQQYLFLDNRFYRTTKEDDKDKTHFGKKQNKWIYSNVKKFNGVTWLISGDQFFGGYHSFESFEGNHNNEFKQFLGELSKTGRKVLFVSGDRHMSEIMEIPKKHLGYKSYELTSSPIHSSVYPKSKTQSDNPLAVETLFNHWNYLLLNTAAVNGKLSVIVKAKGLGNKTFFKRHLSL